LSELPLNIFEESLKKNLDEHVLMNITENFRCNSTENGQPGKDEDGVEMEDTGLHPATPLVPLLYAH
jgi:hypothetical protein